MSASTAPNAGMNKLRRFMVSSSGCQGFGAGGAATGLGTYAVGSHPTECMLAPTG